MSPRKSAFIKAVAALAVAMFVASTSAAAPLTDLEAKGKRLYFFGTDNSEPEPKALLGAESAPAPARLAPCASCHGDDGRGRAEGNIVPPDITWAHLSSPQTYQRRMRPAFSETTIIRAVTSGVDPAGNQLDPIMPRYELSQDQSHALVAYLKAISDDQGPGVSADSIRIAVVLPAAGRSSVAHDVVKQVFSAYIEELNERGGIYNRRIDVKILDADDASKILRGWLEDRRIFAIVILDSGVGGEEIASLAREMQTPSIAATDLSPASNAKRDRYGFSLFPRVASQMRILIDYLAQHSTDRPPRLAILYPEDDSQAEARKAVEEQSLKRQWAAPIRSAYSATSFDAGAAVATLSKQAVDTVVFLSDGVRVAAFLDAIKPFAWRPRLLVPAAAITPTIMETPDEIAGQILTAFPLLADEASKDPYFIALRHKYDIPSRHVASQVVAYCSAQVLFQGLKIAGRDLSRGKFLSAVENMRDFETGVTHRMNFGPNRHVGAAGAYVVGIQSAKRQFNAVSDWMEPE